MTCESCGQPMHRIHKTPICAECARKFVREFEKLRTQKPVLSLSGARIIRK